MTSALPAPISTPTLRIAWPPDEFGASIAGVTHEEDNSMSVQDRVEALREKHAMLERAIDEESHRPLPNQDAISDLKRQKLRIKDEIFVLERQ
jgi:hypothetical protein